MNPDHARQQLDTLDHLQRRVHQRVDRPFLLTFALGLFLFFALKQFGERTETLSHVVLPVSVALSLTLNKATPLNNRSLGRTLPYVIFVVMWILLFLMLGNWNPLNWSLIWPFCGLIAALPPLFAARKAG